MEIVPIPLYLKFQILDHATGKKHTKASTHILEYCILLHISSNVLELLQEPIYFREKMLT